MEGRITPNIPLKKRNRMVRFKGIAFRMDKELQQSIGSPKLTMTRWEAHSQLKKSMAVELLRLWREAGMLINKGTDRQPIYVPAPGYFER